MFEISLYVRNADGSKSNVKKTLETESAKKLWHFWNRYGHDPRKKYKGKPTTAKHAEKILSNLFTEDDTNNDVENDTNIYNRS